MTPNFKKNLFTICIIFLSLLLILSLATLLIAHRYKKSELDFYTLQHGMKFVEPNDKNDAYVTIKMTWSTAFAESTGRENDNVVERARREIRELLKKYCVDGKVELCREMHRFNIKLSSIDQVKEEYRDDIKKLQKETAAKIRNCEIKIYKTACEKSNSPSQIPDSLKNEGERALFNVVFNQNFRDIPINMELTDDKIDNIALIYAMNNFLHSRLRDDFHKKAEELGNSSIFSKKMIFESMKDFFGIKKEVS